ncbi:helix-turn-helix transcriptional regulator [Aminipila butyrica]|uniref:Helix-turn-helix transcriptional regulator n=1 Tax=Aminipila butyrica TaxID=433296 RepID=A0A858BX57_9FIRM|nr:helix-turn-helix transcriptional regulator [Aminipila butyrica]QIB69759.1 helix-turn-helix transcriptional regulator [Aminipila butyrica]
MEREWLINCRNKKKHTQASISQSVGISQQYYSKIEKGLRTPSTDVAMKIANILEFKWTRFYEEQEQM